jgi:hypothetical protein
MNSPSGGKGAPHSLRASGLNNIFLHLYITGLGIRFIADPNLLLTELINSRTNTIYRDTNVGDVKTDILHTYNTTLRHTLIGLCSVKYTVLENIFQTKVVDVKQSSVTRHSFSKYVKFC